MWNTTMKQATPSQIWERNETNSEEALGLRTSAASFIHLAAATMLAPRKILWSTPLEAIERVHYFVPLDGRDTVVDLGCGDGRVLVQWAELFWKHHEATASPRANDADATTSDGEPCIMPTFIGIDVDPERIEAARAAWSEAVSSHRIPSTLSARFHCANALDSLELWTNTVTVLYVYLTPRGMRQLRPLLEKTATDQKPSTDRLRVVSFMNALPNAHLIRRECVKVQHQPDAAWPLFFYSL
jgi:SAM-dependent methyltransferase